MSKNYDVSQGQNVQNYRKVNGQAKKAAQSNTTKPNSIMTKQTNNYSAYGLINNNGAGSKVKDKKGVEYTVIGQAVNGRTVVKDKKGQTQVLAHDGTLLKLSFAQQTAKTGGAKPKSASQTTLGSMKKNLISAKAAFQKQLDDDGWAGDVADGVSALWGSKNRASVIRKELAGEQDRLNQLAQAAQKGDANFKTKFKQIYGVEYNKQAVEAYNKKPNAANFKKAYGSKYPDIRARVNEYNKSQQEGAEVVKTSAKVTTGVAIGVATGGAGLVALGVAAGATTLASAGVEYSDRYKWTGGGGLRKGTSHKKIWKGAAWDGLSVAAGGAVGKIATTAVKGTTMAAKVGRGAINVAGDTGVGAAQEYSETGKVTVTGVVTNATMGGVGSAVTSGVLKEAKAKIVRNFSSKTKKSTATPQTSSTNKNPAGIEIVPKRAKSQTVQTNTTKSGNSAGIEIVSKRNNSAKSQTVQTNTTKSGNSAGIEIVSKKNNSAKSVATKPDNQNILGEKFVDLSDSGVKIKQSEMGTVVVRDKVGNEWVTSLEKGETRPIVTDSSGKRFSISKNNKGEIVIVNSEVPKKAPSSASNTTDVSEIYRTGTSKNESMNTLVQRYAKEDKDLKNKLYDLDITMSQIDDSTIKKLINEELEDLAKNRSLSSVNIGHKVEDIQELVDAVNVRNGKYNVNDIDYDNYFDKYHDFIKYANKDGKSLVKSSGEIDEKVLQDALGDINTYATDVVRDSFDAKKIFVSNEKIKNIVAELKPDDKIWTVAKECQMADLKYVKQDFEAARVNTPIVTFLEHQPNSKAAPYLYNKYLTDMKNNGVSEEAISLCKNLSDKYNVRVFLSSQEKPELALKEVTKEIEKWSSASAGSAKMPATINFSKIDSTWFSIGEYGTRGGRAYSRMSENGGVNFRDQTAEAVNRSFRHEITHSNDTRMILSEAELPAGYNYQEIFPGHSLGELPKVDNLKYADELRRAGISDKYISYAHTNPMELIAVSAEGDMSKYSPEFKKVLVDFGMPEWVFNLEGKNNC